MVTTLVAGVMLAGTTTLADTINKTAKMTAFDGVIRDRLGSSLAIDGTTVLAGSTRVVYAGYTDAGAVYVFNCSTQPCSLASKLLPSTPASIRLGSSVAISGTTAVVGTATDTIYVYNLATCPSTCFESQKLTASDIVDYSALGAVNRSVAIVGQTVVAGAPFHTYDEKTNAGAAYVFDLATCGSACTETRKLTSSDAADRDYFGWSVAIDGTTAVVGAIFNDDPYSKAGSAYVFNVATCGATCTETKKLLASDGFIDELFGYMVGISGANVVVSANGDNGGVLGRGAAYLFVGSNGLWLGNELFIDGFEN